MQRPAAGEFGLGPRASAKHTYTPTLRPEQPLRLRDMQWVPALITDRAARAVEGATISIDSVMPEHGHRFSTRPRVKTLGAGLYAIEGVRFNMGGWREFELAIESAVREDAVAFNLGL